MIKIYSALASALVAISLSTNLAHAAAPNIDFWHSDTAWAGQGMCSANFTFDGGGAFTDPIQRLALKVNAINRSNQLVEQFIIDVDAFNDSNADRYTEGYWESENACEDGLRLVVVEAYAVVNQRQYNLLSSNSLTTRDFRPFPIHIAH